MKKDKLFSIWQMKWIFLVGMIIIIGAVMAFGLLGALFLHFERDQALSMVWMIPIMLVVYYGAVKIMLDNMQSKMGRLADGIHEVAGGNLDVEIPLEEAEEYTRLYEEFNQMVRELKQTREQMEAFTGEFAHEFKTPITSISGFSEYLCETAGPDEQAGFSGETEERLKYLKVIRDQSRRLADLSQSTLLLSKLNAMEVAPPPEELNAGEQIRQTIILMEKQLDEKQIDLDIPEDFDPLVLGSPDLLSHVWTNLFTNALKFTPEGGLIRIFSEESGSRVRIHFQDSGKGMDEKTAAHIFERYYQSDDGKLTVTGNGLGLPIARRAARLCGGDIEVSSAPGKGSDFTVILRTADAAR